MSEHPRLQALPGGLAQESRSHTAVRPHSHDGSGTVAPGARRPARQEPVRGAGEPLWREVLGERLRVLRLAQGEKLIETAGRAGISPQYLSEVERGRKEPSSEMIAALAGALGTSLGGLTRQVADELERRMSLARPVPRIDSGPVLLAA